MNTAQAIDRMRQVIRLQHKALATEDSYVLWLRRYMNALRHMPPQLPSEKKLESFLTDLAVEHDVSASTQNQAFNAILYFYNHVLNQPLSNVNALRAQRPAHERHAPTPADTGALLQTIRNHGGYPTNLIARLLYGCVDLQRRRLCIRGAKGGKDRFVVLPMALITELTQQMKLAKVVWQRDQEDGTPLMLPHQLAKKYPAYQFSWGWAWLFPGHNTCRDPRSGLIVRYRMHEANVQRAVKLASLKLGISVLPHELRHGYASHCLERGTNPRAIQQAMGHSSLETTMGYLHAEALSVHSPLDTLPVILPSLQNGSVSCKDRDQAAPPAAGLGRNYVEPGSFIPSNLAASKRCPISLTTGNALANSRARLNPRSVSATQSAKPRMGWRTAFAMGIA